MRWGIFARRRPRPERISARNSVPTVHEEHDLEEWEEEYQELECIMRDVRSPVQSPKPIVLKPAVILNSIIEENGADEAGEVGRIRYQ